MALAAARPDGGADLHLERVSKFFGPAVAVDDLTLTVPAGSFFALLGPSGCGKTTTLRMVAGLEAPTSGAVVIGGRDVTATRPHRRDVNTVFQSYALFPHMDVAANVAFGLRRRGRRDAEQRARAALDLVELGHLAARKPSQLSGGQQQRVALARAIVNEPAVLLLDEPLGALDLKLRRQMQGELTRIQDDVGITFLHVTHDQEEAMTMADAVAVMNAGRVEQLGAPRELYDLPRTAFVANFLGQSNLLPAEVVGTRAGDLEVALAGGGRAVLPRGRAVSTTGSVVVGVRPEKVHLLAADERDDDGDRRAAAGWRAQTGASDDLGCGTVVDVAFVGVATQYLVDVPGAGRLAVFAQNLGPSSQVARGQRVHLACAPEHVFGLDGDADVRAGLGDGEASEGARAVLAPVG